MNIVTVRQFNANTVQLTPSIATGGGWSALSLGADRLMIRDDLRLSGGVEYSRSSSLLESELGLTDPLVAAQSEFRTVVPSSERAAVQASASGPLLPGVSSTLSARAEFVRTDALLGLAGTQPIARDIDTRRFSIGTSHHGLLGRWAWSATGSWNQALTNTRTDLAGQAPSHTFPTPNWHSVPWTPTFWKGAAPRGSPTSACRCPAWAA